MSCLVEPYETIKTWMPFDEKLGETTLQMLHQNALLGTWWYACTWSTSIPERISYEHAF